MPISKTLPMALFALAVTLTAQPAPPVQLAPPARVIPLYPGVAPGSENWGYEEYARGIAAYNVVRPVLMYYPADKSQAAGTAMIVAPGGGFRSLMMTYEGVDIAKRLNQMGIDAFVLKYRLTYTDPNPPSGAGRAGGAPGMAAATGPQAGQNVRELAIVDGQQAVRLLRQHAAEYGVSPNRIGMIGFSAGGMTLVGTIYGPADARPDFAVVIYGATTGNPPPPAGAPPVFIADASDDQVTLAGCLDLYEVWRKANLPVELHVFQSGGHGFQKKGGGADRFMDRVEEWLKLNTWLTKPAPGR
jgi:acetyl esterase/lipase